MNKNRKLIFRDSGTGPADLASAGPKIQIILKL